MHEDARQVFSTLTSKFLALHAGDFESTLECAFLDPIEAPSKRAQS